MASSLSPVTKMPYAYQLPPQRHDGSMASSPTKAWTSIAGEIPAFMAAVSRASEATATFSKELDQLLAPRLKTSTPPKGKGQQLFESFDVDASGCLQFEEVLLAIR